MTYIVGLAKSYTMFVMIINSEKHTIINRKNQLKLFLNFVATEKKVKLFYFSDVLNYS